MGQRVRYRWARWIAVGVSGLTLLALVFPLATRSQVSADPPHQSSSPFLQAFWGRRSPPVIAHTVVFASAVGRVSGYLARPDTPERLPAVLLLHGEGTVGEWMKQNARDLAGIGYVVLAVGLPPEPSPSAHSTGEADVAPSNERTLVELSAAIRWLRRRPAVWPGSVGVVGWSKGADQALALAAATPVQACVLCDGALRNDPAIIGGLRGTPVLVVMAGSGRASSATLAAFRRALTDAQITHRIRVYDGVPPGFVEPREQGQRARDAADRAYAEIYEFLGKYVEDACQNSPWVQPSAVPHVAVATIADLMLAANAPTGVRGTLARALQHPPANPQQWERVRAYAALLAETGTLLQARTPPRGPLGDWVAQARAYTAAAEAMVDAGDRHDYAAARRGFQELSSRCAACHRRHRRAD